MNKNEIIRQLNEARANPCKTVEVTREIVWEESVQIAKEGNPDFFSKLSMCNGEGRYAVVQHNGSLPRMLDMTKDNTTPIMKVSLVDKYVYGIIMDAIETYRIYSKYYINAYEFVIVYCLTRNIDLIELNIIDL